MRILLIRHGSIDLLGDVLYGRTPGVHLNAGGSREADQLAEKLKQRYEIDEVVSSPLERAVETARFVATAQGLGFSIEEAINEIDFGSWTGKNVTELRESEEWKRYNELRSTSTPPGGECMMQVQTRAWSCLETIAARYQNRTEATVAVVSHGDVIRGLLILLLGMPLDYIHRLEVSPASVSEISLEARQPRVITVNDISREAVVFPRQRQPIG